MRQTRLGTERLQEKLKQLAIARAGAARHCEEIQLKQAELHAIRSSIEKAQRDAPFCAGKQMIVRIPQKVTDRANALDSEIATLRQELSELRRKQSAAVH